MNVCDEGGYLVDGESYYPDDPCDFHSDRTPRVACSHLVCPNCRAVVRQVVSGQRRSYSCACGRSWEETSAHRLEEPDPWPGDPSLPWRCAGHPLATLPRLIDGIEVDEAGLEDLVKRSLTGWRPEGARPEDRKDAIWTARLYTRLRGTPHADSVARAVAAGLDGPEPRARALALNFIWRTADPVGRRRVLELLNGDRAGFAGVPDELLTFASDPTLEDTLWRVATPLVGSLESLRALARVEALAPGRGRSPVYDVLAMEDADWFAAHAGDLARATPTREADLLSAIKNHLRGGKSVQKAATAAVQAALAGQPQPG